MRRLLCVRYLCAATCLAMAATSHAVTINMQYSGTLFSPALDGQAKATINAAAADIGAAITSTLNAVPTDVYTRTSGQTSATFDWRVVLQNPTNPGDQTTFNNASLPTNGVTVFARTTSLAGNDAGKGGPTIAFSFSGSNSGGNLAVDWPNAVAQAAAASQAAYTRGDGPILGSLSGSGQLGGVDASYAIDYGASFGGLWLDNDASTTWHFNYSSPVLAGETDLHSVAMHEVMHILGVGVFDPASFNTWESLTSGTNWLGPQVQALTGGGYNVLEADRAHIKAGTMSTRLSDGQLQEVLMSPTIARGTRKELTVLDLAFLRDLGYSTAAYPADFNGDGDVDGGDLATFENAYGVNGAGDASGNNQTGGEDFLVWQRQYTGTIGAITVNVPEPSTTAMLLLALALTHRRRLLFYKYH